MHAERIRLQGRVQGVGMRPAVYRLATAAGLGGDICNDGNGCVLTLVGARGAIDGLLESLCRVPPPLARIDELRRETVEAPGPLRPFRIRHSSARGDRAAVLPDAASCLACIEETLDPGQRRQGYAFTVCTACGPRLSIQTDIPWDRQRTAMAPFPLCATCRAEFEDPRDRRFHAQPVACGECGPRLRLVDARNRALISADTDAAVIEAAAARLHAGEILAIKALGGFHLACRADDASVVTRLRKLKRRDARPFALMGRDLTTLGRIVDISPAAAAELSSVTAPIVLLARRPAVGLPPAIAPGLDRLGVMLPATPMQHLLLAHFEQPLVMTSGNLAGDTPCTDNDEAFERLGSCAEAFLIHDREIVNRLDDSVVQMVGGRSRVLRLARGLAPAEGLAPMPAGPAVLALGGHMKAAFALLHQGRWRLSQHIGDLDDVDNRDDFRRALDRYLRLFRFRPEQIAIDAHPDYATSRLGETLAHELAVPLCRVEHHHAHAAACLAEHGVGPEAGPHLAVTFDGHGLGPAGEFRGGEFLCADYGSCRRVARLRPLPLPGGGGAMWEPARNLFAHLQGCFGWTAATERWPVLAQAVGMAAMDVQALGGVMESAALSPASSSAGRWFDAVAAALGFPESRQSHEGQAAMWLEAQVEPAALADADAAYPFSVRAADHPQGELLELDPAPMWVALLDDLQGGVATGTMSARFHLGLALAVAGLAARLVAGQGLPTAVALSGGVFQNRHLLAASERALAALGLRPLSHARVPAGDGGLALGQVMVAAARAAGGGR